MNDKVKENLRTIRLLLEELEKILVILHDHGRATTLSSTLKDTCTGSLQILEEIETYLRACAPDSEELLIIERLNQTAEKLESLRKAMLELREELPGILDPWIERLC
jgi:hypothetical protein